MDRVLLGEIRSFRIFGEYDFKPTKNGFVILKNQKKDKYIESFSFKKSDFIKINKEEYKNSLKINNLLFKYSIDCDKIKGELLIRSRAEGDKYRPVSRNVSKTIKKLLNESELTPKQKAELFIIADDEGIVFTNLFGIDERVKVDDNSKNIAVYKAMEGK